MKCVIFRKYQFSLNEKPFRIAIFIKLGSVLVSKGMQYAYDKWYIISHSIIFDEIGI